MKRSGAQIVLDCLNKVGVDSIFGFPGGAVIPLYDALYDTGHPIRHYRTCHEQGAVHAADGYARTTGKPGVCLVTSGPGATNTITGIATAFLDSVPLVVITGQVGRPLIGRDSFQEVDITAMTLTITKHCEMIRRVEDIEKTILRAFAIASSGRPGPVLVDLPKDLMLQETEYLGLDLTVPEAPVFDRSQLEQALPALREAQRPVILAGGGVVLANASEELTEFAMAYGIPVANTLMGTGTFPQSHPLALGLVGMHGSQEANRALSEADLVLALGARFSDRVIGAPDQFCRQARIIQVDIDVNELGKNTDTHFPVQGDLKAVLQVLREELGNGRQPMAEPAPRPMSASGEGELTAQPLLEAIHRAFGDETIVATEVGQHQMWTAQHFGFDRPRRFITSGGLGTMGFGLGAAIGAQIGNPDRQVLHIAGDGSFKMNCNELGTVSKYRVPLKTFVFNNQALGMVRQWQRLFCDGRFSETDGDDSVDFVKLAQAYGIRGYRVATFAELEAVLNEIRALEEPVVVDCLMSRDENVYPIVPPGKAITDMITGQETGKGELA
ncbi:biosynthetic-type acetolactate synthase large subunit [Proteiniclasticum sp. QWL-01]|uniref:biosynthetic-type acetolactate synthase large subunit n=1 Tax=Proteiniclasticum sp. QWL-01 TaxID=3036945 RepID=UPI002410DEFE|nr:biosynthetic-type acetolactate synthase large subunit [Proteiniclasticum sp. QWL-01]WFF74270.1 biosynthetic-type acetolactate synthase large subunit [Proteiniclasticum sp. QWL-01]